MKVKRYLDLNVTCPFCQRVLTRHGPENGPPYVVCETRFCIDFGNAYEAPSVKLKMLCGKKGKKRAA